MDAAVEQESLQQELLVAAIERDVKERTRGRVADLEVSVDAGGVRLRGRCSTYYCKQLAQHAAMATMAGTPLINDIEVWS